MDLLISLGYLVASTIVILAVPMFLTYCFQILRVSIGMDEYRHVPLLHKLNITGGIVFGILLVYLFSSIDISSPDLFYPRVIFETGGAWDLSFVELFQLRIAPYGDQLAALPQFVAEASWHTSHALLACTIALLIGSVGVCLFIWPLRDAALGIVLCILSVVMVSFLTFYAIMIATWLANRLNFLIFLLPLLAIRPPFYFTRTDH